ncbi:hypothetical protein VE00_04786 [Pseudogymnoascus sp. WSF 3629]|nr:hypothetical protein VE00_04786 [Pseudogymnoascus sp. WSF 3629]
MAAAILAVTAAVNGAALPVEIVADARNGTDLPSKLQARTTWCKISDQASHSYGGGGPGQGNINNYGFGVNTYDASGKLAYSNWLTNSGAGYTTVSKSNWKGPYDFTVFTSYDLAGSSFTTCKYQYPSGGTWYDGSISNHISSGTVSVSQVLRKPKTYTINMVTQTVSSQTILTGPRDWPSWISQIKQAARKHLLWPYIDPGKDLADRRTSFKKLTPPFPLFCCCDDIVVVM